MLKSMTGFGRGEYSDEKLYLVIEIKAVNHRYNEIVIRMPRILNPLEDKIRRQISQSISRGRVDVFITLTDNAPGKSEIKVDKEMVLAYNNALNEVAETIDVKNEINDSQRILFLLRSNGVINTQETQSDAEYYWPFLVETLTTAIDNLMAMRIREGNNIYEDLKNRVKTISDNLLLVEERAPILVEEFHKKINDRVDELLKEYVQAVDKDKILHEVALFAERTNTTEEIVRLKSHIGQFLKTIDISTPVGRKLDFIIQEFNREANTIASKANDFSTTQIIVEIKSEIEKIREQIQNIE